MRKMTSYLKVPLTGMIITFSGAGAAGAELRWSVNRLHQQVWSRMVEMVDQDSGVLLDYADLDGTVLIPTPEECLAGKPNAISWWTPIENGAFFNGLYLDALCNKWEQEACAETKDKIKKLVSGLLLLQQVGTRPGFIARGVSTDGVTHYPIGSDDQTFPWFYGLWRYLGSDIPDEAEKAEIIARMDSVAKAVKDLGWRMPCEEPYQNEIRGNWVVGNFNLAVRLLFVNRIMLELTGDDFWQQSLDTVSQHTFADGRTRRDIIAAGNVPMQKHHAWTHSMSVAGLRELLRMETDPVLQQPYRQGLRETAKVIAPFIGEYQQFRTDVDAGFSGDWRIMNTIHRSQPKVQDAVDLAMEQVKIINEASPQSQQEKRYVRWPLFAAWIVLMSEDEDLIAEYLPVIRSALMHYSWDKLRHADFFVGENIFYSMSPDQRLLQK